MKKIKLTLVFCMLTISNLIFASIVHVPNVNTTVAYSAGGGFPTPITLTVDATDIEFTYDDFMGIKAQNWNSPTGNIFTVTPAGTYSDGLKLYQLNDPIDGSNWLNIDGATAFGPMPLQAGQEPAGIHYVGIKTDNNNYAWIMIDVLPGVEFIIMGYAFEDNGNPIDAGDIGIVPPNTIYDIVSNSPDHTTLKVAIDSCALDVTLSGAGPFTLFAPTDAAFDLLPTGTVTALLADIPQLTDILLHHVVEDSVLSTMLTNNLVVPTLNGDVSVSITSGVVFIESENGNIAQVTGANIPADNGVVHVIDAVLLPATPTNGIMEDGFGNALKLYPNPTNGNFSIDLGESYPTTSITITDLLGKTIQTNEFTKNQILNLKIDEPAGIYLLKIESGNQKVVKRLVKE